MQFQLLNPIQYPDWETLLIQSGDPTFYHTSAWAKVLSSSYHYEPLYYSSFVDGRLSFLMPMMEVRSLFTGSRGVSLPFTDQCRPFSSDKDLLHEAVQSSIRLGEHRAWRYIELRDGSYSSPAECPRQTYFVHDISLEESEQKLFSGFSSGNRRNIRAAGRQPLVILFEKSWPSLQVFYKLHCMTRRRHGLPPQPFIFFKNIYDYIISKDLGTVLVANFKGSPAAAAIYFYFGTKVIFKYGASQLKFQNLRPNNLLMWEAIRWFKTRGMMTMNLGRTEQDNAGLLRYKRAWGGTEAPLRYYRYEMCPSRLKATNRKLTPKLETVLRHLPLPALRILGRVFYKHAG